MTEEYKSILEKVTSNLQYNYGALTGTDVRPELVSPSLFGEHRSIGISTTSNTASSCPDHTYISSEAHSRLRAWAFATQAGRGLFLEYARQGEFLK